MSQLQFANNASTTLATAISNSATSLNLAAGTGTLFPNPGSGQVFIATISPASGSSPSPEVVLVTARTTDTITVVRAQEGTTAQAWGVGALVQMLPTAGTMNALLQTTTYAGNPNGYVAGAAATATTPPSTVWDTTDGLLWVCQTSGTASTAAWVATAKRNGEAGQFFNVLAAVSANNAVSLGQFSQSFNYNGYQKLPSGLIIQWGQFAFASGTTNTVTLPEPFPNMFMIVCATDNGANCYSYGAQIASLSQFTLYSLISSSHGGDYIAFGY